MNVWYEYDGIIAVKWELNPNKPICYIDQIIRWRIFFQGQIFVNLKKFLQMAINTELASQCLSKKIFIV